MCRGNEGKTRIQRCRPVLYVKDIAIYDFNWLAFTFSSSLCLVSCLRRNANAWDTLWKRRGVPAAVASPQVHCTSHYKRSKEKRAERVTLYISSYTPQLLFQLGFTMACMAPPAETGNCRIASPPFSSLFLAGKSIHEWKKRGPESSCTARRGRRPR